MWPYQAAETREDKDLLERAKLLANGFKYHAKSNRCYKDYVHKKTLDAIVAKKRAREEDNAIAVSLLTC